MIYLFVLNIGNGIKGTVCTAHTALPISVAVVHKHAYSNTWKDAHTGLLIEAVGGILASVSG